MDEMKIREETMQRDVLLVATAALSLVNGMHFSPLFDPVFFLMRPFVVSLIASPILLFYFTSLLISLMTLAIAGIPVAIYERVRGQSESSPFSIGLWLITTAICALPGILGGLGFFTIE